MIQKCGDINLVPEDSPGNTRNQRTWRNISNNDSIGTDDGSFANRNRSENFRASSNIDMISYLWSAELRRVTTNRHTLINMNIVSDLGLIMNDNTQSAISQDEILP